ncbi:MAG TPA: hypothetical protein VLI90_02260 [Tepidisphaeraceae bacterium]|nr:hypothetical protein [Tepidisphaeraceae bacterium]
MGSLTLPANGTVYLDTMTVICSIETQPVYWPILKPLWIAARDGKAALMTSELT